MHPQLPKDKNATSEFLREALEAAIRETRDEILAHAAKYLGAQEDKKPGFSLEIYNLISRLPDSQDGLKSEKERLTAKFTEMFKYSRDILSEGQFKTITSLDKNPANLKKIEEAMVNATVAGV